MSAVNSAAPIEDRVGFPRDYAKVFEVLRTFERPEKQQIVTVFGNDRAASVRDASALPYPYGSILVMETAGGRKDASGKPLLDENGHPRKGDVLGLHVMRREKGFGEAYGKNRTAEWEYVEYRADGTYIMPPQKSFACAECHIKADTPATSSTAAAFPRSTASSFPHTRPAACAFYLAGYGCAH